MVTWSYVELDDTGSTQAVANGLASMGSPEGTVVTARSQTMGQGRLGRPWVSPVGGLYMSIILRPTSLPRPQLASLVAALAVVDGIKRTSNLQPKIRWPNDVVVDGKKVAGVIVRSQFMRDELLYMVVGIGVNCNSKMQGVPDSGEATSLSEQLGTQTIISEVRQGILSSLSELYGKWVAGDDFLPLWRDSLGTLTKNVRVKMKTDETEFPAKAIGVDPDGNLLLEEASKVRAIKAEDLEWLREGS